MATNSTDLPRDPPDTSIFEEIEAYPWSSDPEFQSGLQSILGQSADPQQAEHLTLRARCFYYSRKKNTSVDFDSYTAWRAQRTVAPATNDSIAVQALPSQELTSTFQPNNTLPAQESGQEPAAPYPTSFNQIIDLITKGDPIPGIKDVPDTLLTGQESVPTTAKRKKPWEINVDAHDTPKATLESHR